MDINEIIVIRTFSGTVRAGIKSFIRLFEKRTDIKKVLNISDEDIKTLAASESIIDRIYKEIDNAKIDKKEE